MISRRRFVELGGAVAAASALGCDTAAPDVASLLAHPHGPFAAPRGSEIDSISHGIARLTFGASPADYARVRALDRSSDRAIERYVADQLSSDNDTEPAVETRLARYEELEASAGELYEYKAQVLLSSLTRSALVRARYSDRQLREVMVDF